MKQSLFSQIEHDKEDILRLNKNLYTADSVEKCFDEIKSAAASHKLKCEHQVNDERHIFSAEIKGTRKNTCLLLASVENSENSIVKWKQAMILSMCMSVMFAFNAETDDLPINIKLYIVSKDDEDEILSDAALKNAGCCVVFDWDNELKNSAASSAVIKNTIVFESACIPLNHHEYYGNPLLCLNSMEAVSTDISSYLPKGAVIRLIPESYTTNDFFHITSLTVGTYTISTELALARKISAILSNTARYIAKSFIVNIGKETISTEQIPFNSDEKMNKIFMHACKENGFIDICPADGKSSTVSAAKISSRVPAIHPCLGLIDTTKEEDIEFRSKRNAISDKAALSLNYAIKAVVSAILDIFQISDK